MRKELDEQLVKKYPKIFRDRYKSMAETAMCWGFECGDGWYDILDLLCGQIHHHVEWKRSQRARALRYNRLLARAIKGDTSGLIKYYTYGNRSTEDTLNNVKFEIKRNQYRQVPESVSKVVASQVKEKFGTLSFYYNGGDDFVSGLVSMAESFSARTCEKCGELGKLRGEGWLYTACDLHTKPDHLDTPKENLTQQTVQN
jgi:hypothetical protein